MRCVRFRPEVPSTPTAFSDGASRVKGFVEETVTVGEVLELEIGDERFAARVLQVFEEGGIEAELLVESEP